MTNDLISREAALEAIHNLQTASGWGNGLHEMDIHKVLLKIPAVDAAPVVHGNNVTPTHTTDMFVCSECRFVCEITKLVYADEDFPEVGIPSAYEYDCKYCPNCGAKMDKET